MDHHTLLCILLFFYHSTLSLCEKDYSECGVVGDHQQIIGPDNNPNNPVGVWPWMASLGYYEDDKWKHQCGATLISDQQHFITAAHCIEESDPNWQIRIGVDQLNSTSSRYALNLTIIRKTIHPRRTKTAYFDIGMIVTKQFELNKLVRPICLPDEPEDDVDAYRNDQMIITGWGKKHLDGKPSNTLKRTDVRVFQQKYCKSTHESRYNNDQSVQLAIPHYFTSQLICAGSKLVNSGTCKGDSGGPLFNFDTNVGSYVQVGLVHGSFGACGDTNIPSIFVRLDDPLIYEFIDCAKTDTCSKGIEATTEHEEGLTKLLVSGGYTTSGNTNSIEIIDLKSATTTCQDLPNFPLALYGTIGGLGLQDKPTICGGYDHDDGAVYEKCYELQGNQWIPTHSMNSPSKYASVSSPSSTSYKLFVTGGTNEDVSYNTAEGLTDKGWQRISSPLPVKIDEHCSVVVNSTTILIIGGNQNGEISSKTYFFNIEIEAWVQGPTLKQLRRQHNCGRIRKDSHSQEMSIIVTGGWIGFHDTSSVEVLDIGANEWRFGPELPFTNDNGEMVEDQDGGVVIIGGAVGSIANGGFSNILFKLSHADGRWTQMEQKLKIERRTHLAFLVPDSVVQCS